MLDEILKDDGNVIRVFYIFLPEAANNDANPFRATLVIRTPAIS